MLAIKQKKKNKFNTENVQQALDQLLIEINKWYTNDIIKILINRDGCRDIQSLYFLKAVNYLAKNNSYQTGFYLIPLITEVASLIHSVRKNIKSEAEKTLNFLLNCSGNKDLDPFLPIIADTMKDNKNVPHAIEKLAGCVFVQNVEFKALAIIAPILEKGLKNKITEIWPYNEYSYNQKLNAITRFVILLTILGQIFLKNYMILLLGILVLLFIVFIYNYYKIEGFNYMADNTIDYTKYSDTNPLNNVIPGDDPLKPESSELYTTDVEKEINHKTKRFIFENNKNNSEIGKIFGNLEDELEFESSMRQFYINPSTSTPNSQETFLQYCYRNLPSDKPLKSF